jgi:hypothetical protein
LFCKRVTVAKSKGMKSGCTLADSASSIILIYLIPEAFVSVIFKYGHGPSNHKNAERILYKCRHSTLLASHT